MLYFDPDVDDATAETSASSVIRLPPKVEITVERLEGIVWYTPNIHVSKEDAKKHVPFVTATVEFSGTCPNMKVHSASKYPHTKHPAVESYFACLAQEPMDSSQASVGEVKKMISTTTQEVGGKTTTTTTTTVTTIQASSPLKYKDGYYQLVAKWHDESSEETLIDSVTYFTNPQAFEDAESRAGTLLTHAKNSNKPHLTLTLPTAADQQQPSLLSCIFTPCQHPGRMTRGCEESKKHVKHPKDGLMATDTHSTAAMTMCSSSSPFLQQQQPIEKQKQNLGWWNKQNNNLDRSSSFLELGSLLDSEFDNEAQRKSTEINSTVTRQEDETVVEPVYATKKSKEMAAIAIAAEPSSAIVGRADIKAGSFTPISWTACGTTAPEIVEIRVRVMPEDSDAYDEMNAHSHQHLAALQHLEGVAHIVFLDQIIEEGTTVMDLPLKIAQEPAWVARDETILSTTPAIGAQEYITLGQNAMLRVRVTIQPRQGRHTAAVHHKLTPKLHQALHQNDTMKAHQSSLPAEQGRHPFYSQPFSLKSQILPFVEKFFRISYFGGKSEKTGVNIGKENSSKNRAGSAFPHEFPTVVPDNDSKKVESFLGEWKSYGESWGWLRVFSDAVTGRGVYTPSETDETSDRNQDDLRQENKRFYTLPSVPRSSSTITDFSGDSESLE